MVTVPAVALADADGSGHTELGASVDADGSADGSLLAVADADSDAARHGSALSEALGLLVEVVGTKGGNRAKYTYTLPPEMTAAGSVNNQTAGSLAAGVLMIARGEVSKKGVVTPEVLDPMRYFGMSAKWGIFYLETEMVPRKIVA
mgnify:CR=1 FL=1